jgi:hypothetical protein
MVVDRFDRDHFNQFIRKFFHVQQTNTVLEYISLFDELRHQMLAHDPHVNPAILTGKFIDGLKPEIRAVVILHRPKDLDSESSLAVIHEEIMQGFTFKDNKKQEFNYNTPSIIRSSIRAIISIKVISTIHLKNQNWKLPSLSQMKRWLL